MRSALLKFLIIVPFVYCLTASAQNGFSTGLNGLVVNLPCGQNCVTQPLRIPHIKGTGDYAVTTIPYTPYTFLDPTGTEDANIYNDDRYGTMFNLPFPFCFYDSLFTKVSVSSNGLITFDYNLENCQSNMQAAYDVVSGVPFNANVNTCSGNASNYPRASIMGIFMDLDPRPGPADATNSSPADRKIEWRVEGTAPFRRFIVSYYKIGVFQATTCGIQTPATFQIVIYESTAVIDVFIQNKICTANGTNGSRAIIGIQNWNRDKGVAVPGRNGTAWTAANEGYRFTPSASASRFISCELQTLTGTPIATGDTITTTAGLLDVTFPNFCQAAQTGQYVIKTTYSACDNLNSQVVVLDTITVNKTNSLNATVAVTPTSCGTTGTGTATVTIPAGVGTTPYTYILTPGNISQTTNQFTGLTGGNYTINVTDASGVCSNTLPITIANSGTLAVTYTVVNTSCAGAANGSITVNPPTGTPPITYSINGGPFTTNNVFPNLVPGVYFVSTQDAAGCSKNLDVVMVAQGPALTITATATPSSCPGANNGSITVTAVNGGTPPYQYSINGGPFQSSPTFNNLMGSPSPYLISVRDASGCTGTNIPVVVPTGTGTVTGTATSTPTACVGVNNGSIQVQPTSGTGPYQYSINGGTTWQASNTFTNLAPGNYNLLIREAGQCLSAPIPASVAAGNGIQATITTSATSCTGVNNGTIQVTPTNGTAPFTFVLDGTTTQTGATTSFAGVSAGNHTITITDAAGCITAAPLATTVTAGTGFTATFTATNSSCTGAANGSITVTPGAGGTGPYTFVLGTTTQTGATSTTFNNLVAGTYSIAITDANGCQFTLNNATVNAGAGFVATYTSTNSTCTGAANGSITVTPGTGGTGPFTFLLGTTTQTGATSTTFNNLASGTYTIQVTDALGCQYTLSNATVTANTGFTATYTSTNSTCTGATNGSITVTPGAGGTAPYTFVLGTTSQTGAASTTFNNLASGSYNILITDANGCQYTLNNATVTANTGFTAGYTSTNTTCASAANGSITVTPGAGGTAPYTFVLNGTTTQTGAATTTFTGLAAGTHSVVITDANGCQYTLNNATVTANPGFTASYTSTNTTCASAANGSLTVTTGAGGTAPYTFVLNGTTTQTGAASTTFTGLAAGTHSVVITDANGCQYTLNNATVTASTGFTATYTATNTSCSGAANGSLTVTPGTGGTGPYTFVLNGTTTQTGATSATFTALAAGTHNVAITDANGCQFTLNNATVSPGPQLNVAVVTTNTTCPGVNNGSVVATPTNGNGPYTFVLDGTLSQTGATATTFNGLAAGSHTIMVTDANGCSINLPAFNIGSGAGITATINPASTSCTGATNGNIAVTPTNGTGPYTFVLNGTITQTGTASTTFANLAAGGSYSITVTDAIGCTGTFNNINVPQGAALQVNTVPTGTTCNTASNGQILVSPTNGSGPYTFVLNGTTTQTGATNTTFTGLAANTYNIVIADAAGCVTGPIPATVNPGPSISVTPSKIDATCYGLATGSINVNASANATAPIEFSLDNTNWQFVPGFTGLAANAYTVYVRDAAGCTSSATITVGQPNQLTAAPTVQNVSCNGLSDGRITVNATGGTPTYTYSLDNTTYQAAGLFAVPAGTYTIYIRDANNCPTTANNVVVTQPAVLGATAVAANATCDGGNDGTITVTALGGTTPYEYAITGGTYQSSAVLNAAPGTHDVTIRDANGCSFQVTGVVVGLSNNLTLTPAPDPAPICEGNSVQLQLTTNATQFAWTPSTDLSNASIINPVATPKVTTRYTVVATLGRCSLTDDIDVTVMAAPVADAGQNGDICYGQSYQLQAVGDPSFTYTWSPSTYLSSTTGSSVTSVLPGKTIKYKLSVTDNNGCQSLLTDEVTVNVTPPIKVNLFPADTVVYPGVQIPLLAISAATDYSWSPATGLNNPNIANPVATAPAFEGAEAKYLVTATTSAGCKGEATVTIRVFKGPDIYVPNAFTPNGDGRNDKFIPFPVGIKKLNYFRVYNRWGQLVYFTTTLNQGWDGKIGGIEQPSGVYIWMAEGITNGNKVISKKGSVMIIR